MAHSDQGIVKDEKASEQPKDKERAQRVHHTDGENSVSREATGTPERNADPNAAHPKSQ